MLFSHCLLLSTLSSSAYAASSPPSSTWDIEYLAGLVDNTYCASSEFVSPGLKVGNATLLKSVPYSEGFAQRVDVYSDPNYGIVVAYEGTNSTSSNDWLYDIDFTQVSADSDLGITSAAMVHQGFQHQHEAVWPQLKETLHSILANYSNTSITVIGHSMGASICQLGALAIEKEFGLVSKIVSFAPVRTGDPTYAAAFNEKFGDIYLGVWNGQDWVPWIILPIFGYEHPENMLWINPENSTSFEYFENSEDSNGPAGHLPKIVNDDSGITSLLFDIFSGNLEEALGSNFDILYWGAHDGIYFHTEMFTTTADKCPITIGGH